MSLKNYPIAMHSKKEKTVGGPWTKYPVNTEEGQTKK